MWRKKVAKLPIWLIMCLVIFSACSSGATGSDEIRIGVTGPLTGPTANSGVALKQGMEIAVEEWNREGGIEIDGEQKQVKMIYEDNQGEPSEGVSAAEKLINQDGVHFLIGDAFASSVTMAIMDLAPQYEIPILSGEPVSSAIAEKVEADPEKYKYFWKGDFDSSAYGESVFLTAQSIIEDGHFEPKNKTVAFIVEDTDYGRSNADAARALFEKDGWEVVTYETVDVDYTDFYPQLTKISSLDPDILVSCFTAVSSGVALVKQFQENQNSALHLAIYYPTRPEFIEQAKDAADGLVWTPLIFDPALRENQKDFAAAVEEKLDAEASSDHAYGYDTMNNALNAIAEAASLDSEKIVEALSQTDRKAVLGRYVFDQNDHTVKHGQEFIPVPAAQIQDGENAIIWPANVATSQYELQSWTK